MDNNSTSKIDFKNKINKCLPDKSKFQDSKIYQFYRHWKEFIVLFVAVSSITLGVYLLVKTIIHHQKNFFMQKIDDDYKYPDVEKSYNASVFSGLVSMVLICVGILMSCWFRARFAYEYKNYDQPSESLPSQPKIGFSKAVKSVQNLV